MRKFRVSKMWSLVVLLAVFMAGCGKETVNIPDTTAPFVISTTPAAGATGTALNPTISATFNEAMAPSTINTTTFTVAGPGGAVAGTVALAGNTATFTPTTALAAQDTVYTATITTGAQDVDGNAMADAFIWHFETTEIPTIVSTNPAAGATNVATNQTISATFATDADSPGAALNCTTLTASTFTLTGPGGPVAGTVNCAGSTATFTPTLPLAQNTVYTATITTGAKNIAGNGLASAFVWTFTTGPQPSVISTVPANGATGVPLNQTIAATFSETMNCNTINNTTFKLTGPAGAPVAGTVGCTGTGATFAPAALLAPNTLYTATITNGAKDLEGESLVSGVAPNPWTFITVPAPTIPTVISTDPVNNATGVPINQKVAATFSEAMNPATINNTTFTLTGPGGVAVAGTVTYVVAGSTATFTPAANLATLTTYVATITTGAQDLAGNALASNYVWTFTTGAAPDTTSPTVIATIPTNGATGVPFNQIVSATFSEAMDPATINATTFKLTGPGTTPVAGLVAYAAIGNSATFTPAAPLLPSTVYTATITTGAQDLAGNPLAPGIAPNPWTFTTGAAPDTTPPTIVSTNPANASVGVAVNSTVNATFSEAMNPLTITTATFQLTGPGGAVITGTVAYDAINFIATFTPSSNLANSTTYVATVTTGATDLAGNPLAAGLAPNPWSFTTAALAPPPAPAVALGTAALFGGFGGSAGMTNQGTLTVINGDIGTTAASTLITGFHDTTLPGTPPPCSYTETPLNIGTVNGTIYTAPPPPTISCPNEGTAITLAIATQARADALTAYNFLVAQPAGPFAGAGELGNLTLTPGTYTSATSFGITAGDLTLDAQGNPNAVFIFQMGSTLTVGVAGSPRSVILINGAQAKNIFWQVGSAATINGTGGGTMEGTIIAQQAITFSTAGNVAITTLNGRALGLNASVTMVNTVINVPAP